MRLILERRDVNSADLFIVRATSSYKYDQRCAEEEQEREKSGLNIDRSLWGGLGWIGGGDRVLSCATKTGSYKSFKRFVRWRDLGVGDQLLEEISAQQNQSGFENNYKRCAFFITSPNQYTQLSGQK